MQYKQLIAYKTLGRGRGEKVRENRKLSSLLLALPSRKFQGLQESADCDLLPALRCVIHREMPGSPYKLIAAETYTSTQSSQEL